MASRQTRQARRRSTRDDAHMTSQPTSPVSPHMATAAGGGAYPPLSPPRPFFIGHQSGDRGSYSSADTSPESDSERDTPPATQAGTGRSRNHRRRSSINNATYAPLDAPSPTTADPFMTSADWSPAQLYAGRQANDDSRRDRVDSARSPPPSSFPFPFQSHAGNPDPGMHVPGQPSRRSSIESFRMRASSDGHGSAPVGSYYPNGAGAGGYGQLYQNPSETDLGAGDLGRPYAPFMNGQAQAPPSPAGSRPSSVHSGSGAVYRSSAAAAMSGSTHDLPRSPSTQTFRAPFLSPASRPSSSLWAPPSFPYGSGNPSGSTTALSVPVKGRAPMSSTRLASKLTKEDKPWTTKKDGLGRASWWVTFAMMVVGLALAGFIVFNGMRGLELLPDSQLCSVLDEDFSGSDIDSNTWQRDVELGGFGNGEFQMTTASSDNSFIRNGQLYIMPTLTSNQIGLDSVLGNNPSSFTLDGCTSQNQSACQTSSDSSQDQVIPPVQSAKLTTQGLKSIRYGKVEVKAKLPAGDWLWPAIWMLPVNSTYGPWPLGGEIDIMEARGNGMAYPDQGINFVRGTLNYGVANSTTAREFGWQEMKRESYGAGFHTYTLEWTEDFLRISVDSKLKKMLQFTTTKKSYFDIGDFPSTFRDGDNIKAVTNPWAGASNSAPFDQDFYLIIDLAVGGTSGWFPDGDGGKMWVDGSTTAMTDFARKQSDWFATWPTNDDDLAFRIDSVKMWQKC